MKKESKMIPKFRAVIKGNKGKSILIYSKDHDVTFYKDYVQFWQGLTKHKIDYKYLMQYTGLLDKNGVEIFEGDVVRFGHLYEGFLNRVAWDKTNAAFKLVPLDETWSTTIDGTEGDNSGIHEHLTYKNKWAHYRCVVCDTRMTSIAHYRLS